MQGDQGWAPSLLAASSPALQPAEQADAQLHVRLTCCLQPWALHHFTHRLSQSRPLVTEELSLWVPAATSSRTIANTSAWYASGLVAAQAASRSMLPPTSYLTKLKPVPSLSA